MHAWIDIVSVKHSQPLCIALYGCGVNLEMWCMGWLYIYILFQILLEPGAVYDQTKLLKQMEELRQETAIFKGESVALWIPF